MASLSATARGGEVSVNGCASRSATRGTAERTACGTGAADGADNATVVTFAGAASLQAIVVQQSPRCVATAIVTAAACEQHRICVQKPMTAASGASAAISSTIVTVSGLRSIVAGVMSTILFSETANAGKTFRLARYTLGEHRARGGESRHFIVCAASLGGRNGNIRQLRMRAILVHGMGRSPLSQLVLAKRLCAAGIRVHLFGYSTLRPFATSLRRLIQRIDALAGDEPYVLVGHSLGCVLIRASLPHLAAQPSACFLLAPPNKVPGAARFFGGSRLYRLLTRDSGQLLSDEVFMAALPVPACPVKVYAGTAGPTGRLSPFQNEANDGILAVSETVLSPMHTPMLVPVLHTFIMNSELVADDVVSTIATLVPTSTWP